MTAAFLFGLIAFVAVIASLALRDHRRALASRRRLFEQCRGVLQGERWSAGGDGFPELQGLAHGRAVRAVFIPDTLVMRRLPQLWLSVTVAAPLPGAPSLSILARHSGNEFYSATLELPQRLEAPPGLPLDVLVRGDGPAAQRQARELAPVLGRLLADRRCKEVTLTRKGVRIVRQVAEGRRGEHLLLRQAVFGEVALARSEFVGTLADAAALAVVRRAPPAAVPCDEGRAA